MSVHPVRAGPKPPSNLSLSKVAPLLETCGLTLAAAGRELVRG